MTTSVAWPLPSVPAGDMLGGVSTKTHSTPSAAAFSMISFPPPREPSRKSGSEVPRSLCHSDVDPCGSQSISMQRRDGRLACAARWVVRVLLPAPPLREAKTMTFIARDPDSRDLPESSMALDSPLRGIEKTRLSHVSDDHPRAARLRRGDRKAARRLVFRAI